MSAFSSSKLTETNAPETRSSNFAGATFPNADTLLSQLSNLTTQLNNLSSAFNTFVATVQEELEGKQDVLEIADEVEEGDTKPVSGAAVYNALQLLDTTLPVGSMIRWPYGATVPTNWHLADGSSYDTTTYTELFELLGKDRLPTEFGAIVKME